MSTTTAYPPTVHKRPPHAYIKWQTPWWRNWDDIEKNKQRAYDPALSVDDKIRAATADFQEWPRPPFKCRGEYGMDHLWDQFRIYIGLSYRPVRRWNALPEAPDDFSNSDESEAEEDQRAPSPVHIRMRSRASRPRKPWTYRVFPGIGAVWDYSDDRAAELGMTSQEQHFRHQQEADENLARFIYDPEHAMKHLFSEYFFKYGLCYAKEACITMPILARYFLRYLHRCRVFDTDDVPRLENAIALVDNARHELTQLVYVTSRLPSYFSLSCSQQFASYTYKIPVELITSDVGKRGQGEPLSLDAPAQDLLRSLSVAETTWIKSIQQDSQEKVEVIATEAISEDALFDSTDDVDSWQKYTLPHPELSRTHMRGVEEFSVRRILGVRFPSVPVFAPFRSAADEVEAMLSSSLYVVTLAPVPEAGDWTEFDPATFKGARDARGETIAILAESEALERLFVPSGTRRESVGSALSRCVGMMIAATWIELIPKDEDEAIHGQFWYINTLGGMLPSFYTPRRIEL